MADEKIEVETTEAFHHAPDNVASAHKIAISQAQAATDKEHRMTLLEGIRTYPKGMAHDLDSSADELTRRQRSLGR